MLTDCTITLDHSDSVYYSGDPLHGYVKLQTENVKSIRAISINVVGYGKVFWNESRGKTSAHFKSYEQYLNSVTYVLGSPEGSSFNLEPGIYEYTFTCILPIELPSSMTETNAKIKYKIIVIIERCLRFNNVFKKVFTINQMLNLNLNRNNKLPRKNTGIMKIAPLFGCCCFNRTDIKAELTIPCGGYVPGQKLLAKLIVYNDSNIDFSGATVKLIKCYTYESTEPHVKQKKSENKLATRYCDNIPRHTNKLFKYIFNVPLLPPTHRTKFIKIDYKVKAKIHVFGYSIKNFYVELPVTIGTIPIDGFDPNNENF